MSVKCRVHLTNLFKSSHVPESRTCFLKRVFCISSLKSRSETAGEDMSSEAELRGDGGMACIHFPSRRLARRGPSIGWWLTPLQCQHRENSDCCSVSAAVPFQLQPLATDKLVKQTQFSDHSVFYKSRWSPFTVVSL